MSYQKKIIDSEDLYDVSGFFNLSTAKYSGSIPFQFTDDSFKRVRAFGLAGMVCACSAVSLCMNFLEGGSIFVYPLMGILLAGIGSFFIVSRKKGYESLVSIILWTLLMFLGFFIIFFDKTPDHRSLFWITVLPPTCILTMGLRKGSILFVFFMSMLMMFFFTPLSHLVNRPIDLGTQLRLLASMLGCFAVVSIVEYARSKTYEALQNAVMHIGQTSLTDTLTGLGNRRYFDKFLEWVMANAQRTGQEYSLAIIDIDHFKRINDTFGHDVGDEVLIHLAEHLRKQIRLGDSLFRWGGEEFMLVMPHCNHTEAEIAAERFRLYIQDSPYCYGTEKIYLTISLGIYSGTEHVSPKIPLTMADQCLYHAKSSGRNRFFISK